jgi:hypothetical protein
MYEGEDEMSMDVPLLQIFEDENIFHVRACIPGVSLEDATAARCLR